MGKPLGEPRSGGYRRHGPIADVVEEEVPESEYGRKGNEPMRREREEIGPGGLIP